jgi:hypothetical protein
MSEEIVEGERGEGRGGLDITVVTGAEAPVELDAPTHGRSRWDLLHRRRHRRRSPEGEGLGQFLPQGTLTVH